MDISTHSASISVLKSGGQFVLSGSYDKSLRLWKKEASTARRGGGGGLSERGVLKGHKAPVLCAAWGTVGTIISGARNGTALLWDVDTETPTGVLQGHKGHVTTVHVCENGTTDDLFLSGAQDGCVRVWDRRRADCIKSLPLHSSVSGSGAVVSICSPHGSASAGSIFMTAGADRAVSVVDGRMSFRAIHRFEDADDFIYSLAVHGPNVLTGTGDGKVLVHNWMTGSTYVDNTARSVSLHFWPSNTRLFCLLPSVLKSTRWACR